MQLKEPIAMTSLEKKANKSALIAQVKKSGKKLDKEPPLSLTGYEVAAQSLIEKSSFLSILETEVKQLKACVRSAAYAAHRGAGSPTNNKIAVETGLGPAVTVAVSAVGPAGKGTKVLDANRLETLPAAAVEHCKCEVSYTLTGAWAEWMAQQLAAAYPNMVDGELPENAPEGCVKKVEARAQPSIGAYLQELPAEDAAKILATIATESRVTLPRRQKAK
jgi:hypothetical protein